jgi:hypothetical protein
MSAESPASRHESPSSEFDAVAAAGTQFRSGISWFYWIAALSLVNTLSAHFANTVFVVGLGATQWLEAYLTATGAEGMTLPLIATAMISGVFAALGYFGLKGKDAAILAGLGLYAADAAIVASYSDWLALAFHAYALFSIWKGYSTLKTAREMNLSQKVN